MLNQPINERVVEIPYALAHLPQSGAILDVGSCDAPYLACIQLPGRQLHCLDPRPMPPPMGVPYFQQNIQDFATPERFGTYDGVLMLSSLDHIGLEAYGQPACDGGVESALAAAWHLLRPRGSLVLTVPVGIPKVAGWYRQFAPYELLRLLKQFEIVDAAFYKYWEGKYCLTSAPEVKKCDYRDGAGAGAVGCLHAIKIS